jgi:hypothetical protein
MNPSQPQPGLLHNILHLLRRPLDPVDRPHEVQVPDMVEPVVIALVGGQRCRRITHVLAAVCRIHDLVADENA